MNICDMRSILRSQLYIMWMVAVYNLDTVFSFGNYFRSSLVVPSYLKRSAPLTQTHRSWESALKFTPQMSVDSSDPNTMKVVSFNILAPCYHRIRQSDSAAGSAGYTMESDHPEMYIPRNKEIIKQLKDSKADIICLQEFWSASTELKALYMNEMCSPGEGGYTFRELTRTSHWKNRDDGLACFVRHDRIAIQDIQPILFHDCGDRVAQMLLLALRPLDSSIPPQQFICVNTHLLFPHNEYSTKIRLREIAKVLGFVESYRVRELCSTICGRSDISIQIHHHLYSILNDYTGVCSLHQFLLNAI